MRNTTQEAEETEPLLAKNLYDTVKKATDQKIPEALKATQQLVDAGIAEEATKASHHAGQGIEQLRQGVERAAESVLGDETAALRRPRASWTTSPTRSIARSPGNRTRHPANSPPRLETGSEERRSTEGGRDPRRTQSGDSRGSGPERSHPIRTARTDRPATGTAKSEAGSNRTAARPTDTTSTATEPA